MAASPTGERTRVLQLLTRMNIGGPARHVLSTVRDLHPHFDLTVAAGAAGAAEGALPHGELEVRPVPLVRPVRPHADLRALCSIRRVLTECRPDVVHTHMAKAGALGRLAARRSPVRPRTVHTFHGHVLDGYFRPAVRDAFLRTERALARSTDVLIAVSAEVRDELLALGIGRPEQYEVIPVGVDLEPFLNLPERRSQVLRGPLQLADDVVLIGVLGRLTDIKDHAALIRALSALSGVHLAIIGDGELRDALESLSQKMRIAQRVHFLGWQSDIPALLADLDIVALTSRNEGTPLALIEASAAGLPVVATRVGGVPAVVREGVTGLLVPPGDIAQIEQSLRSLVARPGQRREMGQAGRRHVAAHFASVSTSHAIRTLYSSLVN